KSLSASMKATVERLRTWDSRSQVHEPVDRNLRQAFSELDRLSDKLSVSDAVVEKSAYIYRKALERGLVRGRSISAIIAAALYVACTLEGEDKTQKDVAEAAGVTEVTIRNRYKGLRSALGI